MATVSDYYNESYAPISDDYRAAEARARLQKDDMTNKRVLETAIIQKSFRKKRQSRYDEDNYALPDSDSESSKRSSVQAIDSSSGPQGKTKNNKLLTWKFALAGFVILVLFSVAGGLVYAFIKSTGN